MSIAMRSAVRIQTGDFDIAEEWRACRARCGGLGGALAAFGGLVRDHAGAVRGLCLEHYPDMTERSVERIVADAGQRWPLIDVTVVHRVGHLRPLDQIVLVLVMAAHRAAAFAACEFLVDYLKTDAVLWKKEQRVAGDVWLQATAEDRDRRDGWRRDGRGVV